MCKQKNETGRRAEREGGRFCDTMKLQTSGLARRGPDNERKGPSDVHLCKDRRRGSVDFPSSVGV